MATGDHGVEYAACVAARQMAAKNTRETMARVVRGMELLAAQTGVGVTAPTLAATSVHPEPEDQLTYENGP